MAQMVQMLSPSMIHPHPRNEEFFDNIGGDEFERFKKSIEEDGIITPLKVTKDGTIISGHQRWRASMELKLAEVPVVIDDTSMDDDDVLRQLIAANFGRMKNDPIKQSKWLHEYTRLRGCRQGSAGRRKIEDNNYPPISQEDIAKELGMSVDGLKKIKRLAKVSPEFQQLISDGYINATTGFNVIAKLSEEEQLALLEQLPVSKKLSQKEVQEYVNKLKSAEFDNARLEAEAKEAERQRDEAKAEVERLRIAEKNAEMAGSFEEHERLTAQVDKYKRDYENAFANSEKARKELNQLKEKATKAIVENDSLKRQLAEAQKAEPKIVEKVVEKIKEVKVEVKPKGYDDDMLELSALRSAKERRDQEAAMHPEIGKHIHFVNSVRGAVAEFEGIWMDINSYMNIDEMELNIEALEKIETLSRQIREAFINNKNKGELTA